MTSMFSCLTSSDEETEQHYKKEDPMILWKEKYGQFITEDIYILTNHFGVEQKMKICIDDFIPFPEISSDVLPWGDYQMDSEETPGTDEYETLQEHLEKSIKKERKRKKEAKKRIAKEAREKKIRLQKEKQRLQKEKQRKKREREIKYSDIKGVILGGEKYYTDWEITKAKNEICIRYKSILTTGQEYINIDAKSEQFLKDLVFLYHPKKEEKKEKIKNFAYGRCGTFYTLCALLKDGTLDTFSQKKPVTEILKKGLIKHEENILKKKNDRKIQYNYNRY